MGRNKKNLAATVLITSVFLTSCGGIEKIEKQTKVTEEKVDK